MEGDGFLGAIKRILTGERKPDHICPKCGAAVGFQSATKDGEVLYDKWTCYNGHEGERGTEVKT